MQEFQKNQFILTRRGPSFTPTFCKQHFPTFEIDEVKERTIDRTGAKMTFVHQAKTTRINQWISAVDEYNSQTPSHLHIHWAGSTEEEHIRVGKGYCRLRQSPTYEHILQKDETYMEWSTRIKASVRKHILKYQGASRLDAPGEPLIALSKRNPKRVYESMNVDEIYRGMNIDPESPRHKHARDACYDTESDNEVFEPMQPRVVSLADVPAEVIHEFQAPAPVIHEFQAPAPVIHEFQAPAPVINEVQAPAPVIHEFQAPAPVINEVQAPVQLRVAPLAYSAALVQQASRALYSQSGVSPFRVWVGNQMFYYVPAPVINRVPAPVIHEAPAPVINEAPAPVIHEAPAPVIHEALAPVINEVPAPVINEAPAPVIDEPPPQDINEAPAPVIDEAPAPVIHEPPPRDINEPQAQQPVNNPQPHSEQPIAGDLVSLAALTTFMQPIFELMQRIVASREE